MPLGRPRPALPAGHAKATLAESFVYWADAGSNNDSTCANALCPMLEPMRRPSKSSKEMWMPPHKRDWPA